MASQRPKPGDFPPTISIPPLAPLHNLTIIFLHGRGSNARKFHAPLLASPTTTTTTSSPIGAAAAATTLRDALPSARFVFPTAPMMRANKYRRSLVHQWYEGSGDWEPQSRGEMRPSIERVRGIVRDEVRLLGGDAGRVVLAGISQGCAMALMCLLLWEGEALGAVVGMCGFMPICQTLTSILDDGGPGTSDEIEVVFGCEDEDDVFEREPAPSAAQTPLEKAISELREEAELQTGQPAPREFPFLSTPVFLGHGCLDEKVGVEHGRQAAELLTKMGVSVDLQTYPDLGHWYSPEMLGDMIAFLRDKVDL